MADKEEDLPMGAQFRPSTRDYGVIAAWKASEAFIRGCGGWVLGSVTTTFLKKPDNHLYGVALRGVSVDGWSPWENPQWGSGAATRHWVRVSVGWFVRVSSDIVIHEWLSTLDAWRLIRSKIDIGVEALTWKCMKYDLWDGKRSLASWAAHTSPESSVLNVWEVLLINDMGFW